MLPVMARKKNPAAVALGRLGGKARGEKLRAGLVAISGAAVPKETACVRCGQVQPSAREAWRHCRAPKPGRPKK